MIELRPEGISDILSKGWRNVFRLEWSVGPRARPTPQRRSPNSLEPSPGFAPMGAAQLSAGTVFEVKCLFAIDAIAAVYRAAPLNWRK